MRAAGFAPEDYAADVVEVWEENWPVVQFFARLSTQWRHGMSGPTGLDYASVLALLRTLRLPRARADEFVEGIQAMEVAALNAMHQKR